MQALLGAPQPPKRPVEQRADNSLPIRHDNAQQKIQPQQERILPKKTYLEDESTNNATKPAFKSSPVNEARATFAEPAK